MKVAEEEAQDTENQVAVEATAQRGNESVNLLVPLIL